MLIALLFFRAMLNWDLHTPAGCQPEQATCKIHSYTLPFCFHQIADIFPESLVYRSSIPTNNDSRIPLSCKAISFWLSLPLTVIDRSLFMCPPDVTRPRLWAETFASWYTLSPGMSMFSPKCFLVLVRTMMGFVVAFILYRRHIIIAEHELSPALRYKPTSKTRALLVRCFSYFV